MIKDMYGTGLLYATMLLGAASCSYLPATRGALDDVKQTMAGIDERVTQASKEISGLKDRAEKIEQKPLAQRSVLILKGTGYDSELKAIERPVYGQIGEKCGPEEISTASEYGGIIISPTMSGDSKVNLFQDKVSNNRVDYGGDRVYQCIAKKTGKVLFSFRLKKEEHPKRVKELMIDVKSISK